MTPFTYDQFVSDLRSALHYLYDPVHLRRSSLVRLFGLEGEFDPAAALQNLLTAAVRALKPAEDEPPQSPAWQIFDILNLQNIRQSSREMIAGQLGISERQLRREQRLALEALAQYLWQRHFQAAAPGSTSGVPGSTSGGPGSTSGAAEAEPRLVLETELAWLKDPAFQQQGSLDEVFVTIQRLAQPLAAQWQVALQIELPEDLADLPVLQMVMRNILLTVLSVVIPRARQAPVRLSARLREGTLELVVACSAQGGLVSDEREAATMRAAQGIAALYGVGIQVLSRENCFEVLVQTAAPQQIQVLVIDDNADWHDLLKRYVVGSRYRVISTRDPQSAVALARSAQPAAIFLDVMMPNVDGWQVLSELRADQAVGSIPIAICSILPLEGLALSLGVNAFLQKPVTQEQFLGVLERLVG
jgi:CheY-like chemotaxis protein